MPSDDIEQTKVYKVVYGGDRSREPYGYIQEGLGFFSGPRSALEWALTSRGDEGQERIVEECVGFRVGEKHYVAYPIRDLDFKVAQFERALVKCQKLMETLTATEQDVLQGLLNRRDLDK